MCVYTYIYIYILEMYLYILSYSIKQDNAYIFLHTKHIHVVCILLRTLYASYAYYIYTTYSTCNV